MRRYVDFLVTDYDLFDEAFRDFALVVNWDGRPSRVEGVCFRENVIGGKLVHFEEIDFRLELWKFGGELVQPLLGWFVKLAKPLGRDLAIQIESVCAAHFLSDFLNLPFVGNKQSFFLGEVFVGCL